MIPLRHKFSARPTVRDGIKFPSKLEAKRYDQLQLLKAAGEVLFFLRQVPFHLPGSTTYRLDFMVFWTDGHVSCEDSKGVATEVYKLKKRQVEQLYPVTIEEHRK